MKSVGLPIAAGLLCLLPAACSETASQPPAVSAPTVGTPAADAAMRTGSSADEKACLKAVERETRNHAVAVLSSEFSQANTEVVIGVGQRRAKWRCLVSKGKVSEMMSLTDEGAL